MIQVVRRQRHWSQFIVCSAVTSHLASPPLLRLWTSNAVQYIMNPLFVQVLAGPAQGQSVVAASVASLRSPLIDRGRLSTGRRRSTTTAAHSAPDSRATVEKPARTHLVAALLGRTTPLGAAAQATVRDTEL